MSGADVARDDVLRVPDAIRFERQHALGWARRDWDGLARPSQGPLLSHTQSEPSAAGGK